MRYGSGKRLAKKKILLASICHQILKYQIGLLLSLMNEEFFILRECKYNFKYKLSGKLLAKRKILLARICHQIWRRAITQYVPQARRVV